MVQYTVFPGRGGTPLQPQEFYVQTYVATYTPFNQTDWPLPGRSQPLDQFLGFNFAGSPWRVPPISNAQLRAPVFSARVEPYYDVSLRFFYNPAIISGRLFKQLDWPVPLAPAQPTQSWTFSYNLNLIGKDQLPTGEQISDLAPAQRVPEQIQLHAWQWSYNLNLIGKDRLPAGEQIFEPAPGQKPAEQPQLRSWQWSYNLNLIGQDQLPIRQQSWPLPLISQQPTLSWADPAKIWLTAPILNITIGQYWDRPQLPVPPAQSWAASYNLNLIGQDHLPIGEISTALPPQPPVPIGLTWVASPAQPVSVAQVIFRGIWKSLPDQPAQQPILQPAFPNFLVLQPTVVTYIIRQSDWPLPFAPQQPAQSWTFSYNLNLIGKDRLPTGEQIFDRPQLPIPPAQTWLDLPKYSLIAKPFFQSDWPNPTQPYRVEQTWARSYNLNLIGQDRLPVGGQVSDLPPRDFARLFQTWISSVNAALVVTPAVLDILKPQRDWPVPRGAEPDWRRSWEWQYNKNLIGQDQLPFRQSDWPLTRAVDRAGEWVQQTNIALLTAVQRPFVQSDWPLPQVPQGAIQTWTNTIGLALTAKPFNQQDWPNPTPPAREPSLNSFAGRYNLNLIGQDRLPNRQQDWPLPSAHALAQIPLQIMVAGKPFFLVPPQPLPPGVQFHGILYDRFIDPRGAAADITNPAWRWPQITPPAVSAVIPLRTLMGTGV